MKKKPLALHDILPEGIQNYITLCIYMTYSQNAVAVTPLLLNLRDLFNMLASDSEP